MSYYEAQTYLQSEEIIANSLTSDIFRSVWL